jgi:hypothetical protein
VACTHSGAPRDMTVTAASGSDKGWSHCPLHVTAVISATARATAAHHAATPTGPPRPQPRAVPVAVTATSAPATAAASPIGPRLSAAHAVTHRPGRECGKVTANLARSPREQS